jgi:hypothetical protein
VGGVGNYASGSAKAKVQKADNYSQFCRFACRNSAGTERTKFVRGFFRGKVLCAKFGVAFSSL